MAHALLWFLINDRIDLTAYRWLGHHPRTSPATARRQPGRTSERDPSGRQPAKVRLPGAGVGALSTGYGAVRAGPVCG
ncbi:hypothetical protein ACH4M4_36315 [Streptomyces sp. NPDC017254]|uniref:hypothetical protein n=1 Tax=unclassified Streptomyces TaxID=2593676 RepID=UPI0037B264E2